MYNRVDALSRLRAQTEDLHYTRIRKLSDKPLNRESLDLLIHNYNTNKKGSRSIGKQTNTTI